MPPSNTAAPKQLSLETLKEEIDFLAHQLAKSSKVVADTGQRVLSIEIENQRTKLGSLNPPKVSSLSTDDAPPSSTENGKPRDVLMQDASKPGSEDETPSPTLKSKNLKPGAGVKFNDVVAEYTIPTFHPLKGTSSTESPKDAPGSLSSRSLSAASQKGVAKSDLLARALSSFDEGTSDDFDEFPEGALGEEGEGEEEGDGLVRGDDLVELVTELQGQLDLLENRAIRRQANGFAVNDSDPIAALGSIDGSIPGEAFVINPDSVTLEEKDEESEPIPTAQEHDPSLYYLVNPFPKTLGEFKNLSQEDVEAWCKFYELLPPDESEMEALITAAGATVESLGGSYAVKSSVKDEKESELTKKQSDGHFDTLARFLGLRARRTKGAW